jgi:hypothetical protein
VNLRRLAPGISAVLILGLWGGVYMKWGRAGLAADASPDRPGSDQEALQKLRDLKSSVVGNDAKTRGDTVHDPQIRPPKSAYDYTPREVCMKMKVNEPEKYKDVDCGSDKFASPEGWKWQPR